MIALEVDILIAKTNQIKAWVLMIESVKILAFYNIIDCYIRFKST